MAEVSKRRTTPPDESGFYLARGKGFKWWNMIAYVYGSAPFLKVDVWYYTEDKCLENADITSIEEFGPKIAEEDQRIVGEREDWT